MEYADNQYLVRTENVLRPTKVEIDLNRLKENLENIKSNTGNTKIMPILKANAYGHGLVNIAKYLEKLNVDYLGVAVLEEGILIREVGIKKPILVLGGILGNQIPLFIKHDLIITASSISKLEQINEISKQLKSKAKVHLKIDTGMERIGVHYYNSEKFLETAYQLENIIIDGIYSHFASSETIDCKFTNLQIERFEETLSFFDKHSIKPPIRHIANSGGILNYTNSIYDMVRPGLLLYGVYPSKDVNKSIIVKSVLSWKSKIVYFKVIKANHPVGYGSKWLTDKNIRAVTVPLGYGDGYFRSMSDKAFVIIRGKKYPVIGTISMDQIVVNIGDDSAYNDDEVILLGECEKSKISCEDLADWAGTISYEILTNINTRVPRIYLEY